MIIELFGIPATGKTTYAKDTFKNEINALKKYIYSDSRLIRNAKKINLIVYLFIFHGGIFRLANRILKEIEFSSKKIKIKMQMYLLSYLSVIKIIKSKKNIYYLDEGILNVVWALAYNSSLSKEELYALIMMLKPFFGDEIIYLDVDKETILLRLLERKTKGGSELEHDVKKDVKYIDRAYDIMNYIYDVVKNEHKVKIVRN